jgi:hydrogenase nickel incorporation protein HypA/HybF
MHELSMIRAVIAECRERAGNARVLRVVLDVGALVHVTPDSLRLCYEVSTRGTPLEGSELEIRVIPGRGRCRACGRIVELHHLLDHCVCGAADLVERQGGDEWQLRSMVLVTGR